MNIYNVRDHLKSIIETVDFMLILHDDKTTNGASGIAVYTSVKSDLVKLLATVEKCIEEQEKSNQN